MKRIPTLSTIALMLLYIATWQGFSHNGNEEHPGNQVRHENHIYGETSTRSRAEDYLWPFHAKANTGASHYTNKEFSWDASAWIRNTDQYHHGTWYLYANVPYLPPEEPRLMPLHIDGDHHYRGKHIESHWHRTKKPKTDPRRDARNEYDRCIAWGLIQGYRLDQSPDDEFYAYAHLPWED